MMSLPTDSAYKTGILTKKKKKFKYPHFNVQNMAKKGNFCLFQDILVAILKSALYLESPELLKIRKMMLLLTVCVCKTGILPI